MMSDILRGLHTSHSLSPLTNHVILSVYGPGRICSEAHKYAWGKSRPVISLLRSRPFRRVPACEAYQCGSS